MSCNICDIIQRNELIKDFGNYGIVKHTDGKFYAIWKFHKNFGELLTCKRVLHDMRYEFDVIVRQHFKKYGIDFNHDPHIYYVAWEIK
jgi:hypothetical protein